MFRVALKKTQLCRIFIVKYEHNTMTLRPINKTRVTEIIFIIIHLESLAIAHS